MNSAEFIYLFVAQSVLCVQQAASARPLCFLLGSQTSSYDEILLVPAEPADGCSELKDKEIIKGQVILVERG